MAGIMELLQVLGGTLSSGVGGGIQALAGLGLGVPSLLSASGRLDRLADLGIVPPNPAQTFAMPRLFQMMALGGEPDFLSRDEARSLGLHRQARRGTLGPEFTRVSGRGRRAQFARTPTLEAIMQQAARAEQDFLSAEQRTLDRFRGTPLGAALLSGLEGIGPGLARAFNRQQGAVLGGAATTGLNLQDPMVRARVLGPAAVQEALTDIQLRTGAAGGALGITRGPLSTAGFSAPPGIEFLTGGFLNTQQLAQQAGMFNTGLQADALAARAGFKAGLAQSGFNLFGQGIGADPNTFDLT